MKKNLIPMISGIIASWLVGTIVAVYSVQDYTNSLMILLFGVGIGFGTLIGLIPGFLTFYLLYVIRDTKEKRLADEAALKAELESVKKPAARKPRTVAKPVVKPVAKK